MICRVVPPWHAVSTNNGACCKASDVLQCIWGALNAVAGYVGCVDRLSMRVSCAAQVLIWHYRAALIIAACIVKQQSREKASTDTSYVYSSRRCRDILSVSQHRHLRSQGAQRH